MKNTFAVVARILAGLLLVFCAMEMLDAQAAVPWAEVSSKLCGQKKICPGDREFEVVTRDGHVHKSRNLVIYGNATLEIGKEILAAKDVAEVRFRHRKPWVDALVPAQLSGNGECMFCVPSPDEILGGLFLFAIVDLPAMPVTAAVEGIRRSRPAQVIKVAP